MCIRDRITLYTAYGGFQLVGDVLGQLTFQPYLLFFLGAVSYTHLDVYKRQVYAAVAQLSVLSFVRQLPGIV